MVFESEKKYWSEFIEIYKENECLWNVKASCYFDKVKKAAAYDKLIEKMKEKEPFSTRECVTKKINSMRTAFRKEYRKVLGATIMGNIYVPTLWYYNNLLFLRDQQDPAPKHSLLEGLDPEIAPYVLAERLYGEAEKLAPYVETEMNNEREFSPSMNPAPSSSNYDSVSQEPQRSSPPKKVKKSLLHNESNRILTMIGERISNSRVEDEWDSMGKVVAAKLRKLPPAQQIFAEKIIHEVLYEGQRGTLSNMAKLCSIDHHHYSN